MGANHIDSKLDEEEAATQTSFERAQPCPNDRSAQSTVGYGELQSREHALEGQDRSQIDVKVHVQHDANLRHEEFSTKLEHALQEAKLSSQLCDAQQWCVEHRVRGIHEIAAAIDGFAAALNLKPLQQKRLLRILQGMSSSLHAASNHATEDNRSSGKTSVGSDLGSQRNHAKLHATRPTDGPRDCPAPKHVPVAAPAVAKKATFTFMPPTAAEATIARTVRLHVHREAGAGLHAHATWYGIVIDEIDNVPGQPDLEAGECIIGLGRTSLQEMDPPVCEAAFTDSLRDGAKAIVETHCETRGDLPPGVNIDSASLRSDINAFSADYEVKVVQVGQTVIMSGPRPAVAGARAAAAALLNKWIAASNDM